MSNNADYSDQVAGCDSLQIEINRWLHMNEAARDRRVSCNRNFK